MVPGSVPFFLAIGLSILGSLVSSETRADEAGGAIALIGVNAGNGGIELVGSVFAVEAGTYRGEMVIDRRGAGGTISTRQAGEVSLVSGERADIARVGISYQTGDLLDVTLTLTREDAFVARAKVSTSEK